MSPFASTRSAYCGQVLRGVTPGLLAAGLAVEDRVVPGAVQGPVLAVVVERVALVRADGREADDVAVRPGAALHALAELDEDAGRVAVRIGDVQRLVDLEVLDVAELGRRIGYARGRHGGFGLPVGHDRRGGGARGRHSGSGQEPAAAYIDQQIAVLHGDPPNAFSSRGAQHNACQSLSWTLSP